MAVKQWSVGDVLTAADMNAWTVPLAVVKPSAQTLTASTTLINDSALVLPVAANGLWLVHAVIEFEAVTGADIKWTFTIPASASGFYGVTVVNPAAAFVGGAAFAWTDTYNGQGNGLSTPAVIRLEGVLNTAGTAGNLQFRWAQNTSNAGATTVMANSALIAQQIG